MLTRKSTDKHYGGNNLLQNTDDFDVQSSFEVQANTILVICHVFSTPRAVILQDEYFIYQYMSKLISQNSRRFFFFFFTWKDWRLN